MTKKSIKRFLSKRFTSKDMIELQGDVFEMKNEIERLQTENEQMKAAVKKDLSDRMIAAGMVPLDAITKTEWLGKYAAHAGMTDMDFFAVWIERKAEEYATMNAAHQSGVRVMDNEICDFVLGKSSAFSEVLANLGAAKGKHRDPA